MNQIQLGMMLKQTWEKVRWIPDRAEWRWKDGDVHLSLMFAEHVNGGTFDTQIVQVKLFCREVDKANDNTGRVPQRFLGSLDGDPLTTSAVRSWVVRSILTEQFK